MAPMTDTEAWKLDRIGSARAGTNPTLLAKMPQSCAVIGDTQFLPKRQRLEFLESMDILGEAVERACRATDTGSRRMNYEVLGNTDAYLHAHLFARYEWEQPEHIGRLVWLYDPEEFYGPEAALGRRHVEPRGRVVTELGNLRNAAGNPSSAAIRAGVVGGGAERGWR